MTPGQWITTGALVAGLGAGVGTPTYWTFLQADPKVTACEAPYTNDGTGAPKQVFKPGETMFTQRNDMFANKVTGPIQRAYLGDNGVIKTLDMIMPPKLTPDGVCSKANFATVIPKDLPPGMYTYSVTVYMQKNPLQRAFAVPFAPVRIKVE